MIKILATVLLFWGPDITAQCELALEIARLLNCKEQGQKDCKLPKLQMDKRTNASCNKKYITRLDFKENSKIFR